MDAFESGQHLIEEIAEKVKALIPKKLPADGGDSATVNGHTVNKDVPADAKFTDTTYSDMTGATNIEDGAHGLVPQPLHGDQNKFLRGDKTWQSINIPTSLPANGGNASTVNGHSVNADVPAGAKFTDTTYADATTTTHGLMSTSDKSKLDGIASGAEANQNAFSNVKVGDTTVAADAKTDTLTLAAGSNVTITPDAANDKVTISAKDTTYGEASNTAAGLLSAADKAKLDGIAEGATNNVVDSALSATSTNPVQNKAVQAGLDGKSDKGHHHSKSDIDDFPTAIKNPNALTLTINSGKTEGTDKFLYDGSQAKTVNITKDSLGLGNVSNSTDANRTVGKADKLTTARNFSISGGASADAVAFDGSGNVNLIVKSVDANKISGTIPLANLPSGALERQIIVADDKARYALTTDKVQLGDTVKVQSTGLMYLVVDDTKLDSADGYSVYTAGSASSVPWSGVTNPPATYAPSAHKHSKADITDFPTSLKNPNSMKIQLNGGTTEGTNQFTYDGSAAKNINVTPSVIGASASGHKHSADDITSGTLSIARGGTGATGALKAYRNLAERGGAGDTDWDTLDAGVYAAHYSDQADSQAKNHQPVGAYNFGTLFVANNESNIAQVYLSHRGGGSELYFRVKYQSGNTFTPWQRAYTTAQKPSKSDVGLGNVDNTADSAKSVKYATSAGTADSAKAVAWANVTDHPTALSAFTNDKGYISSQRPVTDAYNGTSTTTALSQKGAQSLFNDLKNGSVKEATTAYNVGGLTYKSTSKPDNHGWYSYLKMFDITTWYNSTTTGQDATFFNGLLIQVRAGGNLRNFCSEISMATAYQKSTVDNGEGGTLILRSTEASHRPVILKEGDKYYLAIGITGSGHDCFFFGRMRGTWVGTWVNCTDGNGTLPDGTSVVVSKTVKSAKDINIYGNAASSDISSAVKDSNDGRKLTFNYSAAGLDSAPWLAAWSGNELRAIAPDKVSSGSSAKLTTARKLRANLADGTAQPFDGSKDTDIGVTGTLPVKNGGTGATDAATARSNLGLGTAAVADVTAGNGWDSGLLRAGADGVTELGQYIDFHTKGSTKDYDQRISASATGLAFSGTTTGTFKGSLDGNASSATKATNDSDNNAINTTYLKRSGGTMSGQISGSKANSWMDGTTNGIVHNTAKNSSSFNPVVSATSNAGSWGIGTLGDDLYAVWGSDTNRAANKNVTNNIKFPHDKGGTLALTSDIPGVFGSSANGLAPSTASGNLSTADVTTGQYVLTNDGKWHTLPDNAFKNDNTTNVGSMSGTLGINHGGTGATEQKAALSNLHGVGVYTRVQMGDAPNFDDPGVNGMFEIRNSSETPKATGTRPFDGYGPFLSMKTPDNIGMLQISGYQGNYYIRGKQAENVTLKDVKWDKLALSSQIPTTLPASDVKAWAKAATKPSYSASEISGLGSLATKNSLGAGDVGAYTKSETDGKINSAVASVYKFKGSCKASALPTSKQVVGDTYNLTDDSTYGKAGMNVSWNGTAWDALAPSIDLSPYVQNTRKVNGKALSSDITLSASDVGALASTTKYASSSSVGGAADSAVKLTNARNIKLAGDVTGSASFNGTADATINVTVNDSTINPYEANLKWGGKSIAGDISPVDAAMSSFHSANRLAFANLAGVTVEYSNDGGSTWTAYSANDAAKANLINGVGSALYAGMHPNKGTNTAKDQLRITFAARKMNVYTAAKKLLINVSTNGCTSMKVKLERSLYDGTDASVNTPTYKDFGTFDVAGWSGWNSIPLHFNFGGGVGGNTLWLRLTFSCSAVSANYGGFAVADIAIYGTTAWTTNSNLAKTGHIYSWDSSQNVSFPAGVTAKSFSGSLSGNASSATKLQTARALQVNLASESSANFDGSGNQTGIGVSGTLPVSHGGTGATTLASGQALIGNGTGAVTTKKISESKDGSTLAARTKDGYLYASYFNQSSGVETPTASSYWMFANADGFLRKSSLDNLKQLIGPKIANNLTTTEEGWVLDARMGQQLADMMVPCTDADINTALSYFSA